MCYYSAVSNLAKSTTNSAMSLPASSSTTATKAKSDNDPTKPTVSNPEKIITNLAASIPVSSLTTTINQNLSPTKAQTSWMPSSVFTRTLLPLILAKYLNSPHMFELSNLTCCSFLKHGFSPKSCPHLDGYDVYRRDRNWYSRYICQPRN